MEDIQSTLEALRLHPVADHFTVALITVAVLADLCASLFSQRAWFRYMALTLTVLAAASAVASDYTGSLEAHRVKDTLSGPAKTLLHNHAELGDILTYVVSALAVVRIALALFGFMARLRPLYLILAVTTVAAVLWQGHWGGELVYSYGVGTDLGAAPVSRATPAIGGASPGVARERPTPRIEAPMARMTPQAAPSARSSLGGLRPLAPSPAPAASASKAAAAGSVAPAQPSGPTPMPASPAGGAVTPPPAPSSGAPTAGGSTQGTPSISAPGASTSPSVGPGAGFR
jgi:uncharacterized membrane protein